MWHKVLLCLYVLVLDSVTSPLRASKRDLMKLGCIFCDIVSKKAPAYSFWENRDYLAFLSIYPNTPGVSVVIPKMHYTSDVWNLPPVVFTGLMEAAQHVNHILCKQLPDVGRTAMVLEGFGVDHAHVKLFPMHGTAMAHWKPIKSNVFKQFQKYEGYISSHDGPRASDADLQVIQEKLLDFQRIANEPSGEP